MKKKGITKAELAYSLNLNQDKQGRWYSQKGGCKRQYLDDLMVEGTNKTVKEYLGSSKGYDVIITMRDVIAAPDEEYAKYRANLMMHYSLYGDDIGVYATEHTPSTTNTRITYLYRDADNYKFPQEFVVRGKATDEDKRFLNDFIGSPDDGGNFIPEQVGLPLNRGGYEISEADHCWGELDAIDGITLTEQAPTEEITWEEVMDRFRAAKDEGWKDTIYAP